jgi:hypothetical protein
MSEPDDPAENFLQRWSRRKQATETRARDDNQPAESANAEAGPPPDAATPSQSAPPTFDPATLPPLESITAASGIRAFLAPGVPEELTRAALRRAWVTDPTIRDFIGLAENQWDFTRPDEVPGFGSLELTPQLRRMVAQLVGDAPVKDATRPDPALECIDQAADKLRELPPAAIGQTSEASAAGVERALEQHKQQVSKQTTTDALPVPLQADIADAAAQQRPGETAETSGLAHRRHGGAIPR